MKLVAAVFLVFLIDAHLQDRGRETLDLPLSMFRDGGRGVQGYVLFALLLAVGGVMIARTVRLKQYGQTAFFASAGFLLLLAMITPSLGGFHALCAFGLLGLIYVYYAGLLFAAGNYFLLWLHAMIPLFMLLIVRFHSYGLWQKGIIAYFVLALVIHHHLLPRLKFDSLFDWPARGKRGGQLGRRRRVYTLDSGKAWARRKESLEPSSA